MKQCFTELQNLGLSAITELREMDNRHSEMAVSYYEEKRKGNITDTGYTFAMDALSKERSRAVAKYIDQIDELQKKYDSKVDEYCMPSAGRYHPDDVEILKNFELSTTEFAKMTDQYDDNPTMGRLLEDYRIKHNVDTDWRFKCSKERKEAFNNLCFGVQSIIRQNDKFSPNRELSVMRSVSNAYHNLPGSDPDFLPNNFGTPDTPDNPTYVLF